MIYGLSPGKSLAGWMDGAVAKEVSSQEAVVCVWVGDCANCAGIVVCAVMLQSVARRVCLATQKVLAGLALSGGMVESRGGERCWSVVRQQDREARSLN